MTRLAAFLLLCLCAAPPAPGNPLRKAILDALRPSVEAKVGPQVEFVVTKFRVHDGWAFVQAEPQRRGGSAINGPAHFPDWEYMDAFTMTAILRYQNRRWNLIETAIGATDAWYCGNRKTTQVTGC